MSVRINCLCVCRSFQLCHSYHRAARTSSSKAVRVFHVVYRQPQWRTGLFKHRTAQSLIGTGQRAVRWYSSGNQGGGAKGSSSGKPPGGGSGGGGNFFQNFIENFRKGMKGSEVQESLKGFNEEREKMQQSYVVQQAKLKWNAMADKLGTVMFKSSDTASKGWSVFKRTSSKVYKEAADTELGKKSHAISSQLAKDVHKTAQEVVKTDVGQAVKKGSEVVKEDLIDDIVRESNPYKPPEKVMRRSDLASDFTKPETKSYKPNEDMKEVVVTRQSKWKQQWKEWKENNPVSNALYGLKTSYDESDNILIRASRVVTDRVEDVFNGAITQSDMAEALAEIQKIDPTFNKEDFVQQCKYEIIPSVLEAFMQGNEHVLKDWCHEAAFNVLSAVMKQRHEPGVKLKCKVLEVRDVDVLMAKMLEQGPVLVLAFEAQQLTRKKAAKESGVDDEILESVMYIWALCRDQTIYDPRTAWRVLEFGIHSAGKMLI